MKLKAVILGNELDNDHGKWIMACENFKNELEYSVVNLSENDWLENINNQKADILLAKPGGLTSYMKQLYDEKIYILSSFLGYKIFPSPMEIFIYENKRFLSFWLKANKIPHPETDVFYNKNEAVKALDIYDFPLVAKVNIGASGSGVKILNQKKNALEYLNDTFSGEGAYKRSGPNFDKGGILKRGFHYLLHPGDISEKLHRYNLIKNDPQKEFVIFQESSGATTTRKPL